ncbi:MAG: DUF3530 family protein [Gammaproteobacteria bacterium]|nr:DUF3530 family protein [Gammaproteobacteria bacterium]
MSAHPSLRYKVTLLVVTLLCASLAHATFKQREERWAQQILQYLTIGKAEWLSDPTGKFLSIYTAADDKAKGGVILMHDEGQHPDWPDVISPLRRGLPAHGYATLSLQMPILPRGAPLTGYGLALNEAPARISASIKFLRAQGIHHIVLIGHGMGASMGSAYVARAKNSGVQGFVGLAMDAPVGRSELYKLDPRLHAPTMLARIRMPVLDLYGSLDRVTVVNAAPQRAAAAKKAGNTNYTQIKIENADHAFTRLDDDLVERISAWLDQQMASR